MKKHIILIIIAVVLLIVSMIVFSLIKNKDAIDSQQAAVIESWTSYFKKENIVKTNNSAEVRIEKSQDIIKSTARKPIDETPESSDTADEAVIDTPVVGASLTETIKDTTTRKKCDERSPQSITIRTPNGGEVYSIGSPTAAANYMDVKWASCNIPGNQLVKIELISGIDAGVFASPTTLFSFITMNTGSTSVQLRPDTFIVGFTTTPTITPITPGNFFKVKITVSSSTYPNSNPQFNGANINDSSDLFFSIFDGCTAVVENVLPASATSSLINAQPAVPVMKLKVTAQNCSMKIKRFNYTQVNLPYYQRILIGGTIAQGDPRTRTGLLYDFRITEQVGSNSVDLTNLYYPYRIAHWYNNFSGESNAGQFFEQVVSGLAWLGSSIAFPGLNWVLDLPPAPWDYSPSGGSESNPEQFYDRGWVQFREDVVIDAGTSRTFDIKAKPTTTVLKWFHDDPCSVSVFGLSNDDNSDDYSYCGVGADQNRPNGRRENQNIQLILSDFQIEDMSGHEAAIYTGSMPPTSELINIY